MMANLIDEAIEPVDQVISWLSERLPPTWTVERSRRVVSVQEPEEATSRLDGAVDLRENNGVSTTLVVEARETFSPRDAQLLLSPISRTIRSLGPTTPILVVVPWLSERSRELLTQQGINYLDYTGNARIRTDSPALFLQSEGASRDPRPVPRGAARVRGPKASRLLRFLVEVRPPYKVIDTAAAIGLAPGYVSRMLEALDSEALVERSRGKVVSIDVPGLIRRWASDYDVLDTNVPYRFVAHQGPAEASAKVLTIEGVSRVALTGSFAAIRKAAVAAPSLLLAYCDHIDPIAAYYDLLPSDRGANVILLRPVDDDLWNWIERDGRLAYAPLSQVAVDCLTETGRMPAEGEALVNWMVDNEEEWRTPSLDALLQRRSA